MAGGLIVRHVLPFYRPHLAAPLYGWTDPGLGLKFTYPPFAALVFAAVSLIPGGAPPIPGGALAGLSVAANFALVLAALWFTLGGLGCREPRARAGGRCWPAPRCRGPSRSCARSTSAR